MSTKIYTKTGDKGTTSLFGGKRVPKHHERIEAYGTIDELNSHIGLLRFQDIDPRAIETLEKVQSMLFTVGSQLAADPEKNKLDIPGLQKKDVEMLEQERDKMNTTLPELKNFVLPGGNNAISYCHIARCVCRRAERLTVKLAEKESIPELSIVFLNRLSDYLFVLARKITYDFNLKEIPWKPRG